MNHPFILNCFNQSHISHTFSSSFWIIDTTHFFLGDIYFFVFYNLKICSRCSTCIPSTTSRISLINIFLVQDVQVFAYGKTCQKDPLIFVFKYIPAWSISDAMWYKLQHCQNKLLTLHELSLEGHIRFEIIINIAVTQAQTFWTASYVTSYTPIQYKMIKLFWFSFI